MEVVVYHDRKLSARIAEILPANELEYEVNIGLEQVIVDAESGELISTPVLGCFEEDGDGPYLLIDGETFKHWRESGKLNVCPYAGESWPGSGERPTALSVATGLRSEIRYKYQKAKQ